MLLNVKGAFPEEGIVLLFVSCHWSMFSGQDCITFTRDPGPQLLCSPKVCEST